MSDTACADEILGRFALRAYGRPLNDQDRQTLRELYASGSDNGRDFEAGIEVGLARILSGPEFLLYHGVTEDAAVSASDNQDDGAMLASRLALFLWNSIPDDALRDAGIAGRLREPAALEAEVRRMLADPRADTLVTDFAEQWLQLRLINAKAPDQRTFPTFDDNLRRDMLRETELFLRSVLLEDASVLDLLGADYTFLNERLAEHYGVDGVFGDAFRRVAVQDPNRRGLLGQGSILFQTSVETRTSPVFRGKWILTNFFNSPPPPPPADVPALEASIADSTPHSVRERLEQHRKDPVCAGCHAIIDPTGSRSRISMRSGAGATRMRGNQSTPMRRCRAALPSRVRAACAKRCSAVPSSSCRRSRRSSWCTRSGAASRPRTCRPCAASCAKPRATITGSAPSCSASCAALSFSRRPASSSGATQTVADNRVTSASLGEPN